MLNKIPLILSSAIYHLMLYFGNPAYNHLSSSIIAIVEEVVVLLYNR